MPDIQLYSLGLGAIVGFILALTGAGGAVLSIPLLVFALNLNYAEAAPIALLSTFAASSIGALHGLYKGIVRYKAASVMAGFGILLAPLGVKYAHILPQLALSILLAIILIFVAIRSWQQAEKTDENLDKAEAACTLNPATSKLFWTAHCTKRLIMTGGLTGLISGLVGVGGGFIIAPSLRSVSNFDSKTVIATTLATVAIISSVSLVTYSQHQPILWHIAIPFVAGAIISMLILTKVQHLIPASISQKGFALLCLFAAVYLSTKALIASNLI